jgi:hypothetical protein
LRLGSIGELSASLEREAIKPRSRLLSNGKTIAAGRFMVGPLAYLLKNRFYVGDVVYKGEVHKGEHAPILDCELFEAVQARLAERQVRRKLTRSKSSAILMGLIFDDRGHPMSPSHANKKGVRYRYYVSHALLQNRKAKAGSVARVSAPDVEALVCNAVKQKEQSDSKIPDRELLQRHVERVTVHTKELAVIFRGNEDGLRSVRRLACRSPSLRILRGRKGSRMRPPIRKPWNPKRETLFCGRSRARAAGWTQSSPARSRRSTNSRPPRLLPSAMSDS